MTAAAPLVVAVDLDEVLGLFVETLARFHNEVYGGCLTAGWEGEGQDRRGGGSIKRRDSSKPSHSFLLPPSLPPSLPPFPASEHFHSYDFVDVWGGTREEANEKVMAFFESSHFKVREGGREGGRRRWMIDSHTSSMAHYSLYLAGGIAAYPRSLSHSQGPQGQR